MLVLGDGMTYFLSVVRSLGRKGIEVHTGWCAVDSPALRSRYVTVRHDLPFPEPDGAWKPALLDLMRRERFDLVMPTNEQSMRPLQQHRKELSEAGAIYLLDDRAFDVLFDKWKSVELARSLGLSVPRSELAADLESCRRLTAQFGWPAVLKPLSSFSDDDLVHRRGVVKAYNDDELEGGARRLLAKGPVLVQECFVGKGVGVELLACEGKVLAEFQHERVHLPPRGGASTYRKSVPLSSDLLEASRRLVAELKYTGVLMVEFLVNSDTCQWRFVETNARFWGSLPLAIAAGVDFPYYLYRMLTQGERQFPRGYRAGLYCRNLTADLYWAHDNLRALRGHPTLTTVSPGRMAIEWSNVLLLRERFDTLVADDPWPGIVELTQFARTHSAKFVDRMVGRVVRAILHLPAARRRATAKARAALRRFGAVRLPRQYLPQSACRTLCSPRAAGGRRGSIERIVSASKPAKSRAGHCGGARNGDRFVEPSGRRAVEGDGGALRRDLQLRRLGSPGTSPAISLGPRQNASLRAARRPRAA